MSLLAFLKVKHDTVELFDHESAANAALDKVRDDYHPEDDDLQVFSVSLNNHF